jgi:hypothetical protein
LIGKFILENKVQPKTEDKLPSAYDKDSAA